MGNVEPGKVTSPGMRAKIDVADWNGDGRLDILLGDFSMTTGPEPDLTDEQKKHRDELKEAQQNLWQSGEKFHTEIQKRVMEKLGVDADTDYGDLTPEQQQKWGEVYMSVADEVEGYQEWQEENSRLFGELQQYEPEYSNHGWVWVYLQKADAEQIVSASDGN